MAPRLFLRVNGINIAKAWVRNHLEDGSPFGKPEVVIDVPATDNLPALGEITLEDAHPKGGWNGLPDFKVEVRQGKERDWKEITPKELADLLTGKSHG
jgi:hypothetical protein